MGFGHDKLDRYRAAIEKMKARGKEWGLVVVSEGVEPPEAEEQLHQDDDFGHKKLGGIGAVIANEIKNRTGTATRDVTIGHVVRGGAPTPFDRWLATGPV